MRTSLLHSGYILLLAALFSACSSAPKLIKTDTSMVELNSKTVTPEDSTIIKAIQPYKAKTDAIMNEVLGISDQEILKGLPESSLGDFVSDAVLKKTNDNYKPTDNVPVDICLLNNGGLRSQLPKGTITLGNVYELMPFENAIVVLTISGEKMKQLFESIVENNGAPFAGATVRSKGKNITALKINGKDLDVTKTYKVVTSDYLAGGGDKYFFFNSPIKSELLNYKLRDALVDYIKDETKKGNTIKAQTDGRIKYE